VEPRLLDGAAHIGAERAVHGGPDLVVVLEGEADAVDRRRRHIGGEDQAGQVEHLDRAGAQLRQHVGVAAELAVGKQLHVHAAAGLLADLVGRLAQPHVHGMRRHVIVGVFEFEFGGVAASSQDAECRDTARGRRGGAQEAAAAQGAINAGRDAASYAASCGAHGAFPSVRPARRRTVVIGGWAAL
jgi:hypothetical protein